jgi:uncharacterized protein (TIGR02145 family)
MFNKRAIGFCYTTEPVVVIDIDGNPYRTTDINGKRWITSNLKTTHYANGSDISLLESDGGTFSDWHLPSIDELSAMNTNLHLEGVGGFALGNYWSSTEINAGLAWAFNFALGITVNNAMKAFDHASARACRSFTTTDIYALRDTGPAEGLIFHITNNGGGSFTYLESAPIDTASAVHYSNIEALIGVTAQGTAVGTGQSNTTAILAQIGHTTSAAKDCDDLTVISGWINDTTGAYCYFDNDIVNATDYGVLYNWYTVNNASGLVYFTVGGVADSGWRVPTDADYSALRTYLGGSGPMKEIGTDHWQSPNIGATNTSSLSFRGNGSRSHDTGSFENFNQLCTFWTSTEASASNAWYRGAVFTTAYMSTGSFDKHYGLGIRCVKDL